MKSETPNEDICRNNHGGVDTSEIANASLSPEQKEAMRLRILDRVKTTAPSTCEEIETALGLRRSTASARVSELLKDGRLVRTGVKRVTRSGRPAHVLGLECQTCNGGRGNILPFCPTCKLRYDPMRPVGFGIPNLKRRTPPVVQSKRLREKYLQASRKQDEFLLANGNIDPYLEGVCRALGWAIRQPGEEDPIQP